MHYFCENYKGLRIVVKPMQAEKDEFGRKKKIPGVYVKFDNGRFQTQDPELIKFMDEYIKENPGDRITKVDEKQIAKENEIRKKVDKKVREEMEKETKKEEEPEPKSKKSKSKGKSK